MCVLHNVDEESFVETWMAFSITNLNGETPTIETLAQMERKEFSKSDNSSTNTRQVTNTPLAVYNKTPTSNKKYPFISKNCSLNSDQSIVLSMTTLSDCFSNVTVLIAKSAHLP